MHLKFWIKVTIGVAIASSLAFTSAAQEEKGDATWTGEGSLSAGMTTGNTETTDIGLGLDMQRQTGGWTIALNASGDYGETEGEESRNRIFLGSNLDRQVNDKLFTFAQLSYEKDAFSGFESRTFLGGGLGYDIFSAGPLKWSLRSGVGFKIDEIEATLDTTTDPVTVVTPASTEETFGATGTSNWAYQFNENVSLTNDTDVIYAETSTQIINLLALSAGLTDTLSARLSYEVRHDTNPVQGFEATDTITRASLVYGFGR